MASCSKRSVSPPVTLVPRPVIAIAGGTPPSISEPAPTAANRVALNKVAVKPSTSTSSPTTERENTPSGTIILEVPLPGGHGVSRIDVGAIITGALNTYAASQLSFQTPDSMDVGDTGYASFSVQRELDSLLRQHLRAHGVPASYADAVVLSSVAHLSSRIKDAFAIKENPVSSPGERVWQIHALHRGRQALDLEVLLTAVVPAAREFHAKPFALSRFIAVSGSGPIYDSDGFFGRYWPGLVGSGAAALGALLFWIIFRSRRRSVFSHR